MYVSKSGIAMLNADRPTMIKGENDVSSFARRYNKSKGSEARILPTSNITTPIMT